MKLNKSLMAVTLGLSVAVTTQAFDEVYLTGSTAMRSTVYKVLTTPGQVFTAAPVFTGYGGGSSPASGSSDNYMAFYGTLVGNSSPSVVNCYWSGSEAGIQAVASNNVTAFYQTFMADSLIQTSSSSDNAGNPGSTQTVPAQLAMADNAQSFSRTTKPSLTGTEVGIITFKWVRNNGVWTGGNVTDSEIVQTLSGGAVRSVFTGVAGQTDFVYASGRDSGSGTRVNAFGNSGFGILSSPQQIELDGAGNMLQDPSTLNYIEDWGFSSGGNLANSLKGSTTASTDQVNGGTGFSVIAYLSVGDASTATNNGATELTYNGVLFSPAAVEEGNYTFWGNEYIYKANNGQTTSSGKVYSSIVANTAADCDGVKAIALSSMHCSRSGPTAPPVHY